MDAQTKREQRLLRVSGTEGRSPPPSRRRRPSPTRAAMMCVTISEKRELDSAWPVTPHFALKKKCRRASRAHRGSPATTHSPILPLTKIDSSITEEAKFSYPKLCIGFMHTASGTIIFLQEYMAMAILPL